MKDKDKNRDMDLLDELERLAGASTLSERACKRWVSKLLKELRMSS